MSHPQRIVHVDLGTRSYPIAIGEGNLGELPRLIEQRGKLSHAVVVTDQNVADTHAATVIASLKQSGVRVDRFVVPPGEKTKCVEQADKLWQHMLDCGADRKTVVVAVGGGVIGDLAGFIAATFARGLRFVQVPTTLLAQVDSSVGGKVGINLPRAKNMVGAFWQPLAVLIDTAVLETLPQREYRAGLAEVIKYGVILDAEFFAWLEANLAGLQQRDAAVLQHVVARSCELKAEVVSKDEHETTGLRAVLNYGHTFCHAFESLTHYGELLHGEAVAIGMLCASRLAEKLGRIDEHVTRRQFALIQALGLPTEVPQLESAAIIEAMRHDKKVEYGRLRFVLPSRLGHVELVGDIEPSRVEAALRSVTYG